MNTEFINVIRLLRRMTPIDRKSMRRQLTPVRKNSKDAQLLRLIDDQLENDNGLLNEETYLNNLGYDTIHPGSLKKFTYRLKKQIINYFSSETCHREYKVSDPHTYFNFKANRLFTAAKIANEKGHSQIAMDLLNRACKLAVQTENVHLYVEILKQHQIRAAQENNRRDFDTHQLEIDKNIKKRILYDKASQTFNLMLLRMRYRYNESMISILEKHEQLFFNIHDTIGLKHVHYFRLYTSILILQLKGKLNEALKESFVLRKFSDNNELVFNTHYCQLVFVKIVQNLFLLRKGSRLLTNWNLIFSKQQSQMHQYLDLKILQVWCLFHNSNTGNKKDETKAIVVYDQLQLFSLEQANSFIRLHHHFLAKEFNITYKGIRSYSTQNMSDNSNWLLVQLRIIEIMTLIELKKYDLADVIINQLINGTLNHCDDELRNRVEKVSDILKNLNRLGFQFKKLDENNIRKIQSHPTNYYPKNLHELYSTQPNFFMNWCKRKI